MLGVGFSTRLFDGVCFSPEREGVGGAASPRCTITGRASAPRNTVGIIGIMMFPWCGVRTVTRWPALIRQSCVRSACAISMGAYDTVTRCSLPFGTRMCMSRTPGARMISTESSGAMISVAAESDGMDAMMLSRVLQQLTLWNFQMLLY